MELSYILKSNKLFEIKKVKSVNLNLDWGMQNRLARIIKPKSGHCVMLAVDHGKHA